MAKFKFIPLSKSRALPALVALALALTTIYTVPALAQPAQPPGLALRGGPLVDENGYLRPGVSVPATVRFGADFKGPRDDAPMGDVIPDDIKANNLVGKAGVVLPLRRPAPGGANGSVGDRGVGIKLTRTTQNKGGFRGRNDARNDLVIPTWIPRVVTIYAPTHWAGDCLEQVTGHYQIAVGGQTYNNIDFFDWCHAPAGDWGVVLNMNALSANYIRYINNIPRYYFVVSTKSTQTYTASNPCVSGYLWNFNTSVFDLIYDSLCQGLVPSAAAFAGGWSMWESYGLMDATPVYCQDFGPIGAGELKWYKVGVGWLDFTADRANGELALGSCWNTQYPGYRITYPAPNYTSWVVDMWPFNAPTQTPTPLP